MYKAARESGCVQPSKVREILGVTQEAVLTNGEDTSLETAGETSGSRATTAVKPSGKIVTLS